MPNYRYTPSQRGGILGVLLLIVIGLGMVSTLATSTSTASTALAPFAGAQALVIIIPLIFIAIILLRAYGSVHHQGGGMLAYEEKVSLWTRFRVWAARTFDLSRVAKFAAKLPIR